MVNDLYDVIDLKALRCFWAMGRHLSLTRAGIELGISEAAVSQRVKSLEVYLGVKLYEARGGRVQLTDAGTEALDRATALFDQAEALRSELAAESTTTHLSIAAAEPVLRYVLPDLIEQFIEARPQTELRLLSRHAWECLELVRSNEVDLAMISERELPEALVFHPFRAYPACIILMTGHPLLARGTPTVQALLNADTIARYPLVSTEEDDPADQRLQQTLREYNLPYNVRLHVGNLDTVKHYVARGLGVAVVPTVCITDDDRGKIEAIDIPEKFGAQTMFGVILRRDKHHTGALGLFLQTIGTGGAYH